MLPSCRKRMQEKVVQVMIGKKHQVDKSDPILGHVIKQRLRKYDSDQGLIHISFWGIEKSQAV